MDCDGAMRIITRVGVCAAPACAAPAAWWQLVPLSARGATNERSRDVTSVWARPRPRAVPPVVPSHGIPEFPHCWTFLRGESESEGLGRIIATTAACLSYFLMQ